MQILNKILVVLSIALCGFTCLAVNANPAIEKLYINYSSYEMFVNDTVDLIVRAEPTNAKLKGITWSTSDLKLASVSRNGKVYAKKEGEITVTAKIQGKCVVCAITILPRPVTDITLSYKYTTLLLGEKMQLGANIIPTDATYKTLIWTRSADNVVCVDGNGNIEAKAIGTATITATAYNGVYKSLIINVTNEILATNIQINKSSLSLKRHEISDLSCVFTPSNATNTKVEWTSSYPSVANVSSNGVVSALKEGTTTITGRISNGLEVTCTVTVTEIHATIIMINDSMSLIGMEVGDTASLVCSLLPRNTTDLLSEIEFSSMDTSIVTIDQFGKVVAVGSGQTQIKLKLGDLITFHTVLVN